jgi:hypothetical protein
MCGLIIQIKTSCLRTHPQSFLRVYKKGRTKITRYAVLIIRVVGKYLKIMSIVAVEAIVCSYPHETMLVLPDFVNHPLR